MALTDVATKYRYEGNGTTDTFSFPAKPFSAASLVVQILTRSTGDVVETLSLSTEYAVTIASDKESASITVVAGKIPSATQDILIYRTLTGNQSVELPVGTPFPSSSLEQALDKLTALHQQQAETLNRALRVPLSEFVTASLEVPTDRNEKVLAFDASGNATVSTLTLDEMEDSATDSAASAAAAAISATSASNSAISAAASLAAVDAYKMIWKGAWVTATPYTKYDVVSSGGSSYICIVAHTSGVFSDDLAAAKWELLASAGAAGSGTMASVVAGTGISVDDTDPENPNVSAVIASQAEAEAGASSTTLMTPERTAQAIAVLSGSLSSIVTQRFTSNGTYTPTSGMAYAIVEVQGAGGGGGGGGSSSDTAGGGGGGGYAKAYLTAAQVGASQSVTIGAAGSAGSNGTGGTGGTTSLGTLISCTGGAGGAKGTSSVLGGAGGTATVSTGTAMLTVVGQYGGAAYSGSIVYSGVGGNSVLGHGGGEISESAGRAGTGYGSGGSGGMRANNGGAGAAGIVIITEYVA